MKIVADFISIAELQTMASALFGDLVKGVVDVEREILALDAELHSDLEAMLLEEGSNQLDLWGINLYPALTGDAFLEFDSMINLRPAQGNKSRGVDDPIVRRKILAIIEKRILP